MGTGSSSEQSGEETLCLLVDDWREEEPSTVLLNEDDVPFDGPLDDCLNPRSRLLEFRFKFPVNFPGGKHRFLNITQSLLSNKATLGIKTLFLGKSARGYVDDLKKSRYGRVKWSDTIVVHGCQVSWTEDRQGSSITNFKFQIDEDEFAVAIVDREHPIFFGNLNNDKRKFVDAITVPIRILLRVTWWKELFGNAGIDLSSGSLSTRESDDSEEISPEDQWWWPIVLEAQQRSKAKAKAAALSASTSLPAAEEDAQESSGAVKKRLKKNKGKKRKANHRNRARNTTRTSDADVKTEKEKQQTLQSPSNPPSPTSPDYLSAYEALPSYDTLNPKSEDQEGPAVSDSGMVTCPTSPIKETEHLYGADPTTGPVPETVLHETRLSHSSIPQSPLLQSPVATPPTTHLSEGTLEVTSVPEGIIFSHDSLPEGRVPRVSLPTEPLIETTPGESTPRDTVSAAISPESPLSPQQDAVLPESESSETWMASKTEHSSEDRFKDPRKVEILASNTTTTERQDQDPSSILLSHPSGTSSVRKEVSFAEDPNQNQNIDTVKSPAVELISKTQQSQDSPDTQKDPKPDNSTASTKTGMAKKKHAKKKKRSRRQQTDPVTEQDAEHQPCVSQTPAQSCPASQSSRPASALNTTQVPISSSDSPSLQPNLRDPKATSGTLTKDSKSSLDPLASEYVPNFKPVQKTVALPETSKAPDSNVSSKKKKASSSTRARANTSPSKSAAAKGPSVNVSSMSSQHNVSPSPHSSQPTLTDDIITQSLTHLQDDQRNALLASRRNSTTSFFTSSTLDTATHRGREVTASRSDHTEKHARNQGSDGINAGSSVFESTGSFERILLRNEHSAVSGQASSHSAQRSSSPTRRASISSQRSAASTNSHQTGHLSSSPDRSRLPPIQEATREHGQRDITSLTGNHSAYALSHSHPEPDSTELTARDPEDTSTCQTPTNLQIPQGAFTTSPVQTQGNPPATSQLFGSHGPPAPPSTTRALPSIFGQGGPVVRRPAGFFWQLDSHGFPCAKADCDKRCSSWDGASVVCPRCGPFSEVRYCNQEHLYEDIKPHWAFCGQMTFCHPCRESTIPRRQKEGPPLLPSYHNWDTPERHRQAVYHATNSGGDYFIFADWAEFVTAGQPANNVGVRCTNRVLAVVNFDEPGEKDRFRRVLGVCLFASIEVFDLVDYMFRLIRDNLRSRGLWSGELDKALRYQMQHELAVAVSPETSGQRHACETEWDGRNRRRCADPVCRAEYRPLLGDQRMGRGFVGLCDYMESNHWLLRAARRTHPEVTQVAARTRGEGFGDVAEEDRRLFRRGEGWDGAGTGEMEIEGVNA
ncbi:hypothetical protein DTO207G8_2593 [Paecilomyces variotii]|nr:hypothetical protein DTO207G8_2593 [Paecilomyces variotii]KAJ9374594.1 hypothetical protein DTO282E5_677 [Paecilomyces variotii]